MSKAKYDGIAYEYSGCDYLTRDECSDMRTYNREQKSLGWWPLCNGKARFKNVNGTVYLESYYTNVLAYDVANDTLTRLWDGYSKTTMRHVDEFLAMLAIYGVCISSKRAWSDMPVGKPMSVKSL